MVPYSVRPTSLDSVPGAFMLTRTGLVAITMTVSLLWAGGCACNPRLAAVPAPRAETIKAPIPGADEAARRLERDDLIELPPGTEQDLGRLHFDSHGADFTVWIAAFKKEVYRNWVVPEAARFGSARGHVDFKFTIETNGTTGALRMMKSSGTASLDEAARNALGAGKFTALPNDYSLPRVTMQVTFFYNEPPT
jgi:TonB family protein